MSHRMPDLRRDNYYGQGLVHLSEEERQAMWTAGSYLEARETLSKQTVVPSLSFQECLEELHELGIPDSRIDVVPVGFQDGWQGEVLGQFPPPGAEIGPDTRVRLFLSHPSLADRLPDGFVDVAATHETDESRSQDWDPEVHRERREVARREEPAAARFLRVLEATLWRTRSKMKHVVTVYEGIDSDAALAGHLLDWIHVAPHDLDREKVRWLGNSAWRFGESIGAEPAAEVLGSLLGVPVDVARTQAAPAPLAPEQRTPLGTPACRLGAGAALGESLDDRGPEVQVRIGPVDPLAQFQSRDFRETVEAWVRTLLPASQPWSLHWVIEERDKGSALGPDEPNAVLGYTARLGTTSSSQVRRRSSTIIKKRTG